ALPRVRSRGRVAEILRASRSVRRHRAASRRRPSAREARRARRPPLERPLLDRDVRARVGDFDGGAGRARGPGRAPGPPGRVVRRRGPGASPLGPAAPRQAGARVGGDAARRGLPVSRRRPRPLPARDALRPRRRMAAPRPGRAGAERLSPSPDSVANERDRRGRRPDGGLLAPPLAGHRKIPPPLNHPRLPPDSPEARPNHPPPHHIPPSIASPSPPRTGPSAGAQPSSPNPTPKT